MSCSAATTESQESGNSSIDVLPDDVLFRHILSKCSVRDVFALARVNKAHRKRLLDGDMLWENIAHIWYPEARIHVRNNGGSLGDERDHGGTEDTKAPYDTYKDLIIDDNARHCGLVWMDSCSSTLLLSPSRQATIHTWCLCEVNIMEISAGDSRRAGRRLKLYTTIHSRGIGGWAMEGWMRQSSIALVKRNSERAQPPRRYGDIVKELYRLGFYPTYCYDDSTYDSKAAKVEVLFCDIEASHALEHPEHAPEDVYKIVRPVAHMLALSPNREEGFVAWYEFMFEELLDTIGTYDIVFTFGQTHPYLPSDGVEGNHPIILAPLQEFIESACHSRYKSMTLGPWSPIE